MSNMIKRFIFERVSENIITKPWMKSCYRDYQTREIVMAAYPLNYAITLAWMLNLAWQRYRHRESWIDRMIASEARSKIIQLERERERDEWRKKFELSVDAVEIAARLARAESERDEARELHRKALSEREATEKEVDAMLERSLKAERERDEAREALMKIEDLFIDGTDIYADREKMGIIARNALEGVK
jgi:hypothetical protein